MTKRILSLAPSNTEILFALGVGPQLIGVTTFCDYPQEAKALPKVGSWLYPKDLALFDQLKPDLIFTSLFLPQPVETWAKEHSVPLIHLYPQTLAGIYTSIREIAEWVNRHEEAKRLIDSIQAKLDALKAPPQLKIYSEEFHNPPTVGANWVPELITLTGGIPLASPGILSYEVSFEEVHAFDPDLVVFHWCGFGNKQKPELLKKRKGWESLRAIQEGNIFTIDDSLLNRPGPRIWQGAQALKSIITEWLNVPFIPISS